MSRSDVPASVVGGEECRGKRTISTIAASADGIHRDSTAQQRTVIGTTHRGQLLRKVTPGYPQLGHPARGLDVQTRDCLSP